MNKILLGAALLFATGASAQTYFEDDFAGALSAKWTTVDSDGDGENWYKPAAQGGGTVGYVTSASWKTSSAPGGQALTPDNWLVSKAIDLTTATGTTMFSWIVQAQDQAHPNENYSVYVGTSDEIADFIAGGVGYNEVVGYTNGEWIARNINVSSFHGNTIYVAFRHHESTDEFRINLDDVSVSKVTDNDLALDGVTVDKTMIGDRVFTVKVKNTGVTAVTAFDLELVFEGTTLTESVSGINLAFGAVHSVNFSINGITAGSKSIAATITTADDIASNNTISGAIEFLNPVPQFIATDSKGNAFNLHDRLSSGQAIVIDYMASWCNPCLTSTPALSEFIENNGSGEGKVEALAITVESNDNASVLNGLNWNGNFYKYPKFPYTATNSKQYSHYSSNHELNPGNSIPLFILICPNFTNPELSTIIKSDAGYFGGMFNAYQNALDQCPTATLDVIELSTEEINFNVYPNPSNRIVNVEFELKGQEDVTISIVNTVGQTVAVNDLGTVSGVQTTQMDVSALDAGIYIVKVKTANGEKTKRISVN